jgi:hypothetical protein
MIRPRSRSGPTPWAFVARVRAAAVRLISFGGLALAGSEPVGAQELVSPPARTMAAVRLVAEDAILVDGLVDEAVWQRADVGSAFLQRDPDNGAAATERTEVRVLYDDRRLILGVICEDSEPGSVLANQLQRDESFGGDDRFLWTIDTFLDGRGGYFFEINPAGAMGDGLIDPSSDGGFTGFGAGVNRSWDGIWIARVRRTATGWSAEIEIPFGTLNFDPRSEAWGINFQRTIRRKSEDVLWTGHLRNQGLARMASAGRLTGLSGLSQGLGLDIKPYVVGSVASAPGRGQAGATGEGDAGVDVYYNLTPALRANLSVNTDFAETEVDQRRVNLTRFPIFFEEKRDFFLQGASYFDFGRDPGQVVRPFFSRRIGLDPSGVPQRISAGAKVTGQAGAYDVGALQVRTGEDGGTPGEDFSVLRVRRRAFEQSYFGGLYTRRAGGATSSQTAGLDFALRTASFRGREALEVSGYSLWTGTPGTTGGSAYGFFVRYPNDPFRANVAVRAVQPGFLPAMGFVERVGFRQISPDAGYYWRPDGHPWFREFDFQVSGTWLADPANRRLTSEAAFRPFDVNFHDGSRLALDVVRHYERLEEDFEISDGVSLPAGGEYTFTRYNISGQSADHRAVAIGGRIEGGAFFSGRRREYAVTLDLRPRRGVALSLEVEHNTLELQEGRFDTDVLRFAAGTQLSPWISIVNNLQYDSVSRLLGWQMRVRWIQRPGNDLFLVYTHNWQDRARAGGPGGWERLDNRLATKLVYTLRF